MTYNVHPSSYDEAFAISMAYLDAGIVPLLIGPPGIGKTMLAEHIAQARGAALRKIRLNNIPPEEAIGLQYIDDESKCSVRLLPDWVPAEDGSDGPVVVFLDELTQAPDEYRKGIMSALNERYLGPRALPDNCLFIAAGNSIDDGTNVHDLDAATAQRFGIIVLNPSFSDWADNYAQKAGINLAFVAFLRIRTDFFEMHGDRETSDDNVVRASPRTWEKASVYLASARARGIDDDQIVKGLSGLLGSQVADAVWAVVGEIVGMPTIDQMMQMDDKAFAKQKIASMDMLWAYGQSMVWAATSIDAIERICGLLDRMESICDPAIPFAETRSQVFEIIAKRARLIHNLQLIGNPAIGQFQMRWNAPVRLAA